MKKLVSSLLAIHIFLLYAGPSVAAGALTKNKVEAVAFRTGGLFLYANAWGNPNSCTKSDAVVLLESDPNYDKAYSLILAAYMSGKRISGYSNGCVEFNSQTYNTIRGYKYLVISD